MIRRPPRSTLDRSSAASDVYKRQDHIAPGIFTLPSDAHADKCRQLSFISFGVFGTRSRVREPFVHASVGQNAIDKTACYSLNSRLSSQTLVQRFVALRSLSERCTSQQSS